MSRRKRSKNILVRRWRVGSVIRLSLYIFSVPLLLIVFFFCYNQLLHSAFFNVHTIHVFGNERLDRSYILDEIPDIIGINIFAIDIEHVRTQLIGEPYIADVIVRRELPGTIHVEILERNPIAIIEDNGDRFLVSRDGMVLERAIDHELRGFPFISVKAEGSVSPGTCLSDWKFQNALNVLSTMNDLVPECFSRLMEIKVEQSFNIQLKLLELSGTVIVSVDGIEDSLKRLQSLFPKLVDTQFASIDFRFDKKAVVKLLS